MSWNYQNKSTGAPFIKIQVIWDFFKQADYILMFQWRFPVYGSAANYILIENKNKFYLR